MLSTEEFHKSIAEEMKAISSKAMEIYEMPNEQIQSFMNIFENTMVQEIKNWGEEEVEGFGLSMKAMEEALDVDDPLKFDLGYDSGRIEEMALVLAETDINTYEVQEILEKYNRGMPRSNQFFSSILHQMQLVQIFSLDEAKSRLELKKDLNLPRDCSALLTFVLKIDCSPLEANEERDKFYANISEFMSIDTRESWKETISDSELKERVDKLHDSIMKINDEYTLSLLYQKLTPLVQELNQRNMSQTGTWIDTAPTFKIVSAILKPLIDLDQIENFTGIITSEEEMYSVYKSMLYMTVNLMKKDGILTESNVPRYIQAVQNRMASMDLIDVLSYYTRCKIDVYENERLAYDSYLSYVEDGFYCGDLSLDLTDFSTKINIFQDREEADKMIAMRLENIPASSYKKSTRPPSPTGSLIERTVQKAEQSAAESYANEQFKIMMKKMEEMRDLGEISDSDDMEPDDD
jgi:hypothetical protein